MNEILWHNRARKQIKLIPAKERETIHDRIDLLAGFPDVAGVDVKPLTGHQYGYRLRVGRYRILFDYNNGIKVCQYSGGKKKEMNVHIEPQIINSDGKPAFAVIPWDEYQMLISTRQELDIWFPNDVVKANSRGVSLIAAWREHFAMTQAELAEKCKMKQTAIARLEKGHAGARRPTLARIAAAMGIMVEQLIE